MKLFDTISYLKTGNPKQVQAYNTLTQYSVMEVLSQHMPILAGTVPLEINIDGSDLDVLCHWDDKTQFVNTLTVVFGNLPHFTLKDYDVKGVPTVKTNFIIDDFELEIFGQNIPVKQQYGYRHLVAEYHILQQQGEAFRQEIIRLKQTGYKTEAAFAKLLRLDGDPYEALLQYSTEFE